MEKRVKQGEGEGMRVCPGRVLKMKCPGPTQTQTHTLSLSLTHTHTHTHTRTHTHTHTPVGSCSGTRPLQEGLGPR